MIHGVLLLLIALLMSGSLLSLSSRSHWFVRAWDFPRIQIVAITLGFFALHVFIAQWITPAVEVAWAIGLLTLAVLLWHSFRILPFTRLMRPQAESTLASRASDDAGLRILVSNLELENDSCQEWSECVRTADPDVVIALEPGKRWVEKTRSLQKHFPYRVIYDQENWYGMMLLSRRPIEEHHIHFLVQDDVPSIDATLRMKNGRTVRIVGVHPRPPEPVRGNDSTPRDAELSLWGRKLKDESGPVVIGGDLNDVAWSQTTRLFLRTSGLLDPRRGRGLFNTFHAERWWMRFPLDHVFHSSHFTVVGIQRLPSIGSDHFPILIDLQLEPEKPCEPEDVRAYGALNQKNEDQERVEERIERADENAEQRPEQSVSV
ncbi:endonuclease/exonuclease/phosphatase family protein [Planctomycetes bacterium K23_9]|uniref:Endonuclease/exonuclease/phosphatase domain-containing protein n=1 Tax=Stieleria marina TaxID=1930275 RepID=A0A517NVI8_9BACT|nr:hypothetical protein K239x_31390 [Planctomycetes bacterium K23_9]